MVTTVKKAPVSKVQKTSAAKASTAAPAKKAAVRKPAVKKATVKKAAVKTTVVPVKKIVSAAAKLPKTKLTAKVAATAPAVEAKVKKPKLVRDSFTIPEQEYEVLGQVKKTLLAAGVEVKKSQLLRVGLVLIKKADLATLKASIAALTPLKAGRPKKDK